MAIALLEPDAGGRTSGGYRYNRAIHEHAPSVALHSLPLASLEDALERLPLAPGDLALVDSLFLTRDGLGPFMALRERRGVRLGALLHAFPSFIARAADRAALASALPLTPTTGELELVQALGVVVTPGAYVARLLADAGSEVPCVVCPPGVDSSSLDQPDAPVEGEVRLVMIANLTPAKGVADALRALATIADGRWSLTLIGSLETAPRHAEELQSLSASLGADERVRFAGALSHAETLAMLARSDVLVLSSYTENAPLVAFEALAHGVPVVGYAVGGLPDIVTHERSGLLVPLLDETALARALRRVLSDADERARLANGAREAGRSLPSWHDAARAFQGALEPYSG